jgi:hypothetical protein
VQKSRIQLYLQNATRYAMPPASARRESQYVMAPFFAKKEKEKRKKENLKFHNGFFPAFHVILVHM